MKTWLIALSLIAIIGLDYSIHILDASNSYEITVELGSESSESESKESSEKHLNDYMKCTPQQLLIIQSYQKITYLSAHCEDKLYHNHWDEIPYPPPESC